MENRVFPLGSEWLYVKFYLSVNHSDRFLTEVIHPLMELLIRDNVVDKFFFIRYVDKGGFHLRLRIHFSRTGVFCIPIEHIYLATKVNLEQRVIKNITYDTYIREIERYNYLPYSQTESLFYYDSKSQLELLNLISKYESPTIRWQVALLLIDDILDVFYIINEDREQFLMEMRNIYRKEFGCDTAFFIKNHNNKYREYRLIIERTMARIIPNELIRILSERRDCISSILGHASANNNLSRDFISSIIHMSINRFFESSNRKYEMTLYEFLYLFYHAESAKKSVKV